VKDITPPKARTCQGIRRFFIDIPNSAVALIRRHILESFDSKMGSFSGLRSGPGSSMGNNT
jgi:hypothetical protein